MARLNTATTGAAGEHYVMYQLLMRGNLAALTPKGAKGVDILICDEDGGHLAAIQVKTSGLEVTGGWHMNEKHENLKSETLFYCFVAPGAKSANSPTCWIVPSAIVADHVYTTHRSWLAGEPKRGTQRNDSPLRKIHLRWHEPPLDAYPSGWMDKYKEAWHLLERVAP